MTHPMQPIILDEHGTPRFQRNPIVRFLLNWASPRGMDLNELARMGDVFSRDDWQQFAQLIGYSVSGFGDLSYAPCDIVDKADEIAEQLLAPKPSKCSECGGDGLVEVSGRGGVEFETCPKCGGKQ